MMREKKANDGMVLTNGEAFTEVGGIVYLGCNDKPENWYEITDEEAEQIQQALLEMEES